MSAETKDFDFTIGKNHTGWWCVGKKEEEFNNWEEEEFIITEEFINMKE